MLLRDLLAEDGSIYVHCDWRVNACLRLILDEVFGRDRFTNQISWQKIRSSKGQAKGFGNVSDTVFFYAKTEQFVFNKPYSPLADERIEQHYSNIEPETGRRYMLDNFSQAGQGEPKRFGNQIIVPPSGKHWIWSQDRIDEGMTQGMIVLSGGGMPRVKRYLDNSKGNPVEDIWSDIAPLNSQSAERVAYPTQKPEALLERIIKASSNEGDLVLDCFCGSGTTVAVAEKLNRRWITCDLGRFAIHTTRKRLLGIANVKPFVVQNLGKYERQAWQAAEFASQEDQREREIRYRKFILDLYHAEPVNGHTWLHGIKSGRMVHVGAVDAPVTLADVKAIAAEIWRAIGKGKNSPQEAGVDVLGWEFAFELNELARQVAAEARVDIRFKKIPREVLEKRAVEQGDIHFFELAALSVDLKAKKKGENTIATLMLKDFIPPHDDVPQEVLKVITHWSQWIDYWAVDWNYKGDTFHNEWQSYRTRKGNDFVLETSHAYEKSGTYNIVIKVIDILGNDTTKTVQVEV
ncbi:site-specific DNA-methyltransferase [candidate division KSB1 bacterium]|nr:site-specific DNA-methyltransferase [candidate division KSB1 bacterium]